MNTKKPKTLNLKRTVTIKAIVTENFKKYLTFEHQQAIKNANTRMNELKTSIESAINRLKTESRPQQEITEAENQLQKEQSQYQYSVAELNNRLSQINQLKLESLFVQGTIDGFVTVKEGDNLYKKLGGMEIIIKDGIVQKIQNMDENEIPNQQLA